MPFANMADAFGAPIPVTVKGTEYYLSPFTFGDWAKLEQWLKSSAIRVATSVIASQPSMSVKDRRLVMDTAWAEASTISLAHMSLAQEVDITPARNAVREAAETGDEELLNASIDKLVEAITNLVAAQQPEAMKVRSLLLSPDGIIEVVRISLDHKHRGISREKVETLLQESEHSQMWWFNTIVTISTAKVNEDSVPKGQTASPQP